MTGELKSPESFCSFCSLPFHGVSAEQAFEENITLVRRLAAQILTFMVKSRNTDGQIFYTDEAIASPRPRQNSKFKIQLATHTIQKIKILGNDPISQTNCRNLLSTIDKRDDIIYLPDNEFRGSLENLVCERRIVELDPSVIRSKYNLDDCASKVENFLKQNRRKSLSNKQMLVVRQAAYLTLQKVVQDFAAPKQQPWWWQRCLTNLTTCTIL